MSSLRTRGLVVAMMLHDVMQGFRAGCGTGNSTLEAKLLQQLTVMWEAVLSEVFILVIFAQKRAAALVPSGGLPGRGFESNQHPGLLCAPPHMGHDSDPVGRELTVPQVPPV